MSFKKFPCSSIVRAYHSKVGVVGSKPAEDVFDNQGAFGFLNTCTRSLRHGGAFTILLDSPMSCAVDLLEEP